MSDEITYPIDVVQDLISYPLLQEMAIATKNDVQELQKKVEDLKTSEGSADIGFLVADENSSSNADFKPGKMGLVQIYNRSGGLEVRELKNGSTSYGPRLFVACAGKSEMKYGGGNANNPVSAELFQYAMKLNSYKGSLDSLDTNDSTTEATANIPPSSKIVVNAVNALKNTISSNKTQLESSIKTAKEEAIYQAAVDTNQFVNEVFGRIDGAVAALKSRLNVKVKVLPKGDATGWVIPPSTFAILSTYGAEFTGTEKYDDGNYSSKSFTLSDLCIIYSSEEFKVNGHDVYRCFLIYPKNFSLGYEQLQYAAKSCKIKNTFTGNSGTGATHIQYITFSE